MAKRGRTNKMIGKRRRIGGVGSSNVDVVT
jgi:hypothetical protein